MNSVHLMLGIIVGAVGVGWHYETEIVTWHYEPGHECATEPTIITVHDGEYLDVDDMRDALPGVYDSMVATMERHR